MPRCPRSARSSVSTHMLLIVPTFVWMPLCAPGWAAGMWRRWAGMQLCCGRTAAPVPACKADMVSLPCTFLPVGRFACGTAGAHAADDVAAAALPTGRLCCCLHRLPALTSVFASWCLPLLQPRRCPCRLLPLAMTRWPSRSWARTRTGVCHGGHSINHLFGDPELESRCCPCRSGQELRATTSPSVQLQTQLQSEHVKLGVGLAHSHHHLLCLHQPPCRLALNRLLQREGTKAKRELAQPPALCLRHTSYCFTIQPCSTVAARA